MAMDVQVELKRLSAAGKLVFGTEETVKLLRKGKVQRVLLSSNCDPLVRSDIEKLAGLAKVDVVSLEQGSEEIGVLCKKPFGVSVVAVQ
ncbi:ribosomal L7Ae/L30e/S12e/Gadd45 family protein [Candidatus Woesearchaeota archaeon]|nr:ribosomal L7Ae/L30e/S12e/Gadd45 family protein [Candidatus Woesearchaeota archaeon]